MSNELDLRAREAAAGLKEAVASTELRSSPPGSTTRGRPLAAILRPAWIVAILLLSSAVGVALVRDPSPAPTTLPPATTTAVPPATTVPAEPSPPTSAALVPAPPATTSTTSSTSTTIPPDLDAPSLEITSPEDGAELSEKVVTFAGTTEPGARVFAGPYEAEVDSSGGWHIVLVLSEGPNLARFVARDQAGNESQASVTVHYVAPTTTTTTEKELAEFTAHAKFGSCSETPPFDLYYGTGEPGSVVKVTSEHGSGSVEVGGEGHWELEVIFESAPPGEAFVVDVSEGLGRQAQFEFIYQP